MNQIYTLNTYGNDSVDDGLTIVYDRIKDIAPVIDQANVLSGRPVVLVAGLPTLYHDRINANHVNICITTYENFPLPLGWLNSLHQYFAAVIVPHESIKILFEQSGVKIPIHVAHQGYTRLPLLPRKIQAKSPFKLGFLGVPVDRKNLDLLIDAVSSLFLEQEIMLYIHVSKYYDWVDKNAVLSLVQKPFIRYSEGYKSEIELASWYQDLDVYIFPSSGEGWSFTPRESLSLAIPTILSDIPVHSDLSPFCKSLETPITTFGIKNALLDVYNNINTYQEMAILGQNWVQKRYQNEEFVGLVRSILEHYARFEF